MKTEIILLLIISTLVWIYHRYQYKKTTYTKFSDYLECELNFFMRTWITLFQILVILYFILGVILLVGEIGRFIFINHMSIIK